MTKKRLFKKMCAFFLVATMLFSTSFTELGQTFGTNLSVRAETLVYGDFQYTDYLGNRLEITDYLGNDTDVVIPGNINGYDVCYITINNCDTLKNVTVSDGNVKSVCFSNCANLESINLPDGLEKIETNAFSNCTKLETIAIPDSVTSIGVSAFYNCQSLKQVKMPSGLRSIGSSAFQNSGITEITIPYGVTYIEYGVFHNCSDLKKIDLPDSIKTLGENTFLGCSSLTSIKIPSSISSIGEKFYDCTNLANIYVDENNMSYSSVDGVLFSKDKKTLIRYPIGKESEGEYCIPSETERIDYCAFWKCMNLTKVILPEGLSEIDNGAFSDCTGLTSIELPNSIKSVRTGAFGGCTNLKSVSLSDKITYISERLFYGCTSLTDITLKEGITYIYSEAFKGCTSLSNVVLPETLENISENSFSETAIFEIVIPANTKFRSNYGGFVSISDEFDNMDTFPEGVTLIVTEDSPAHHYAEFKCINYVFADEKKATVTVQDKEGNIISSGYTVEWYEKDTDTVISTGQSIYEIDKEKEYQYKVILDEELSYLYKQPEHQDVVIESGMNHYTLILEPLENVNILGRVFNSDNEPLENVQFTFTQCYNKEYVKTVTAKTDSNGFYSIQVANVPTSFSAEADGYIPYSKTIIANRTAEVQIIVDDVILNKLPKSKIEIFLKKISASTSQQTTSGQKADNFNGLVFSLYNKTTQSSISDFTIQYPYIIPKDSMVNIGDEIENSVNDTTDLYGSGYSVVSIDEQKMGFCKINITENGKFMVNTINENQENTVMIFSSDGKMVNSCPIKSGYLSNPMVDGNYKIVFIKSSILFRNVMNISKFEELGLISGKDYIQKDITLTNGIINALGNIDVPLFDEKKFYYTVENNTLFTANETTVSVGKYVVLRCEYEINNTYSSSDETVSFEMSENVRFTENSLTVDSKRSAYSVNRNTVTVPVNQSKGIIRFYVYATDEGDCVTNAYLSMKINSKSVLQPLGTTKFYAEKRNSIALPKRTSRKKVPISGTTVPRSDITIYDNDVAVGNTKANAVGTWQCDVVLDSPDDYSEHDIYCVVTGDNFTDKKLTSDVKKLIFDKYYIELSKITMIHHNGTTEFDFLNPPTIVPSYSYAPSYPKFTFKVEFSEGDDTVLDDVYVLIENSLGQTVSIPVKYDRETNSWLGTYDFNDYTQLPISISASYNFKDSKKTNSGMSGTHDIEVGDYSYHSASVPETVPQADSNSEFRILSTDCSKGRNGRITLGIKGNLLTANMTAVLKNGGNKIEASDIYWKNHTLAYAVFDMTSAKDGTYTLEVKDNGKSSALENCFKLDKNLSSGGLDIHINIADSIKAGEVYKGSVTVTNTGYNDVYAPVLTLKGKNLQFDINGYFESETIVFVPNTEALAGVIRKGETAHINFSYKSLKDGAYALEAKPISSTSAFLIDNTQITADSSLEDVLKYNYTKINGSTNIGFNEKIAKAANLNDSFGLDTFDIALLSFSNIYNAAGNLGFSTLESFSDISTTTLSYRRTYYAAVSNRYENGIMGYGWSNDDDITAQYVEDEENKGIVINSPSDTLIFVKDNDSNVFKNVMYNNITASKQNDEIVLHYSDNDTDIKFNKEGKISLCADTNDNWIKYIYNSDGQLQSISNNYGEKLLFSYLKGKLSKVTSSVGDEVSYGYENDYLTSVTTKYGTQKYSYNTDGIGAVRHSLVKIEYPDGAFKEYTYDKFGRVIKTEDNESYIKYSYGNCNDIVMTDKENKSAHIYYNTNGNIVTAQ